MRPHLSIRHAATLLSLLLTLPLALLTVPGRQQPQVRAEVEPVLDRVQVLRDPPPSVTPQRHAPTPRAKARRITRSHRTATPLPSRTREAAPVPVRTRTAAAAPRPRRTTATASPTRTATRAAAYPYAGDTTGGSDPWGFTKRQCVSYVAWRLDQVGRRIHARQGWGDARSWDETARSKGRTVTTRPSLGAVAQWNAGERSAFYSSGSPTGTFVAGSQGHVGWVTKVYADGSVHVAQYNGTASRSYSTMRVKAPRFLRL